MINNKLDSIKNESNEVVSNAIEVKNVKKKFKVFFDKGQSLKEKILFKNRNHYEDRWVLKGVSFNVKKGEAIGLIGQNGCGKSTLLKLMTKIIYPDCGEINIKGRVSSLIELGAGFHPDMSGRENIYINASIFGLTKKEIDNRIDDIIRFSELEEFIDNPVRTYSSGMYMRLAFSVAINVDAEVLLIDEILAVGDANFQAKCFNKMREIKASGTTIVLVSHALNQVEQICEKAYWIKDGCIEDFGEPRNIIPNYMNWIMSKDTNTNNDIKEDEKESDKSNTEKDNKASEDTPQTADSEYGNKGIVIERYKFINVSNKGFDTKFSVEDNAKLEAVYSLKDKNIKEAMFSIAIIRSDGVMCYTTNTLIDTGANINLKGEGKIQLFIEPLQLMQGEYSIDISLTEDYGPIYHCIPNAIKFSVYNAKSDYGVFKPNHRWIIE